MSNIDSEILKLKKKIEENNKKVVDFAKYLKLDHLPNIPPILQEETSICELKQDIIKFPKLKKILLLIHPDKSNKYFDTQTIVILIECYKEILGKKLNNKESLILIYSRLNEITFNIIKNNLKLTEAQLELIKNKDLTLDSIDNKYVFFVNLYNEVQFFDIAYKINNYTSFIHQLISNEFLKLVNNLMKIQIANLSEDNKDENVLKFFEKVKFYYHDKSLMEFITICKECDINCQNLLNVVNMFKDYYPFIYKKLNTSPFVRFSGDFISIMDNFNYHDVLREEYDKYKNF